VTVCGSLITVHVILSVPFILLNEILPFVTHNFVTYVCIKNTRTLCETCIILTLICDDLLNVHSIYYYVFGNDKCDTSNRRNV
jgi:hypothetical protein